MMFQSTSIVEGLRGLDKYKVWILVIAGNDPNKDVAALTRGGYSTADIDRLMVSTNANIISNLKQYPEKVGILASVLDSKIIHLPITTALAISREYSDEKLKNEMRRLNMNVSRDSSAKERLGSSELAYAFSTSSTGPQTQRKPPGSNTTEAFSKLAEIASKNDIMLNNAIGCSLQDCGLITSFELENEIGRGYKVKTDLFCKTESGSVRLEIMWRKRTSRAEIANYVLTKLYNYGKAIGYLNSTSVGE